MGSSSLSKKSVSRILLMSLKEGPQIYLQRIAKVEGVLLTERPQFYLQKCKLALANP